MLPCTSNLAKSLSRSLAWVTLVASGCAGPDHLLDPVLSQGGSYFASLGGWIDPPLSTRDGQGSGGRASAGGSTARGGSTSGGNATTTAGLDAPDFDWSDTSYDAKGGDGIGYQQGHYPGLPCFSTCHDHAITLGGTAYQANGTTAASNVQIGILVGGKLSQTYSGTAGNFYLTIDGDIDWATAQIAVRTDRGSRAMPLNSQASGNCNGCHKSSNRIVTP